MRALTLTQPWCGLMAAGIKLVENRPRAMGAQRMIGERIALHASREIDERVYQRIHAIAPELVPYGQTKAAWAPLTRVTSKVIATAVIKAVIDPGSHGMCASELPEDQRRWFFGPVGIVLRDVRALPVPITCRGMLGFWTLSPAVEAGVRGQVTGG